MDNLKKTELIRKFNAGELTDAEQSALERMIESGEVQLEELEQISSMQHAVSAMRVPTPSGDLDDRFYQMLALQKRKSKKVDWSELFSWDNLVPKLALATFMLMIGIGVGYIVKPSTTSQPSDMQALTQEVVNLKEMMMLSLLEKESATERLKAVNLTQDMDDASVKVTNALVRTLNEDENVNVRLAALEALKPYVKNSEVRQALIQSIAKQQSPLVQISLAELMVMIQEKSSVKEFEKIIGSERTPEEVKSKIKESIKVLI